jgi:hypothetical protein
MSDSPKRRRAVAVLFPLLFAGFVLMGFSRTAGSESVRPLQIVDLVAAGMLIGVALAQFVRLVRGSGS